MGNLDPTDLKSVKDRLLFYINYKNITPGRFEKMTKLSNGYIHNIVNTISDKTFENKIRPVFTDLNKVWILHGEGEMLIKESLLIDDKTCKQLNIDIKNLPHAEQMEMLHKQIKNLEDIIEKKDKENEDRLKSLVEVIAKERNAIIDVLQKAIKETKKESI